MGTTRADLRLLLRDEGVVQHLVHPRDAARAGHQQEVVPVHETLHVPLLVKKNWGHCLLRQKPPETIAFAATSPQRKLARRVP